MAATARAARPVPLLVEAIGWVTLVVALSLLSWGVAYRAEAEPAASADGPTCSVPQASGEHLTLQLEQQIEMLRAQVAANASEAGEDAPIVLNGRGYNYRPTPAAPAPPAPPEPAQ